MTLALSFERVSKDYRGPSRYHALRDDLVAAAGRLFAPRHDNKDVVRALDDLTFEIEQGEAVALMGPNGSGKTTALKIMSRITYPTRGMARVRGRVGALIEVGTGLHPELTGRENIELYGRILGISGPEIRSRFNSIVDFAEIGNAIYQPVKQYSSGMQLRLGFSLAAHLEPDILLVDEAVSVGDAGFQHRCAEYMAGLVKAGVTLVFVSHIPSLVATLCRTGILLNRGHSVLMGSAADVINGYLALVTRQELESHAGADLAVKSWEWEFHQSTGRFLGDLVVHVDLSAERPMRNPRFGVGLTDGRPGNLVACSMLTDGFDTGEISGSVTLSCVMRDLPLEPGTYTIWMSAMTENGFSYIIEPRVLGHAVLSEFGTSRMGTFAGTSGYGAVRVPYEWNVRRRDEGVIVRAQPSPDTATSVSA
jgi:ABC-type polysaccharide/polyol phosphate transport system ATPase subunit